MAPKTGLRDALIRSRATAGDLVAILTLGIALLMSSGYTAEKDVGVKGFTRKDGTYVEPHMRSAPDGQFQNNWSTKGNVNPYTGELGTTARPPDSSKSWGPDGSRSIAETDPAYTARGDQQYQNARLRIIGTNLFDFGSLLGSGAEQGPFVVGGEVMEVTKDGVLLSEDLGVRFVFNGSSDILRGGPEQLLSGLAAFQLSASNRMSLGQYLTLSPEVKRHIVRERQYKRVFLNNCPPDFQAVGKRIRVFALPTGEIREAASTKQGNGNVIRVFNVTESHGYIPRYDFGQPYFGDINSYSNRLFQVTGWGLFQGLTEPDAPPSPKPNFADMHLLAWQFQQASNGGPHAQYDLAVRYLKGNGVEKSERNALYWLTLSAARTNPSALKLLESITKQK